MAALKYWIWLTTRRGITPLQTFQLLDRFGTPEAAYFADREEYRWLHTAMAASRPKITAKARAISPPKPPTEAAKDKN